MADVKMTGKKEITMELLNNLLTASQAAELLDVPVSTLRRATKKGEVPGVYQALGRIGYDPEELEGWEAPESIGVSPRRREDGKLRWKLWATQEQKDALVAEGYEIEDPREASRERRKARKTGAKQATMFDNTDGEDVDEVEDLFEGMDA